MLCCCVRAVWRDTIAILYYRIVIIVSMRTPYQLPYIIVIVCFANRGSSSSHVMEYDFRYAILR